MPTDEQLRTIANTALRSICAYLAVLSGVVFVMAVVTLAMMRA